MSNIDKIRTKIAALLRKTEANGASEAEASAAMTIASKLMAEHSVTMQDLRENAAAARDFTKRNVNEGAKNMTIIDKFVVTAIAVYTDTKAWNSKEFDGFKTGKRKPKAKYSSNITFYGYSVDVELAEYIYKICDSAVETEWKKFSRTVPTGARAKARVTFQLGMSIRLRDRLLELKQTNVEKTKGNDLVVLKKQLVETAFNDQMNIKFGKAGNYTTTYRAGKVFDTGQKAGDAVRFNREVYDGPKGGVKLIA